MTAQLDQLHDQVAVRRHGQSAYASPGERSRDQRTHDGRAALDLVSRVSFAAGRAEGFEEGHRAGRRYAFGAVGLQHLVDLIQHDLDAIRRDVAP